VSTRETRTAPPKKLKQAMAISLEPQPTSLRTSPESGSDALASTEQAAQYDLLKGVSRTFALTIPLLPSRLAWVTTNAYLLCRIVDTIEDEPAVHLGQKRLLCELFADVLNGDASPQRFTEAFEPHLSDRTIPAEHELIQRVDEVVAVTNVLDPAQREILVGCVHTMSAGMLEFQQRKNALGLDNLAHLDRYCYYVAGVVGEMLTRLFCHYSAEVAVRKDELMQRAVSFGQGLQMTNIIKDIWQDYHRGACWLPRDVFNNAGLELNELKPGQYREEFDQGLSELIGIAHGHCKRALEYTLLIPRDETGIRRFCLLALGLAVLTLRKLDKTRAFRQGADVKISRRSVHATLVTGRLTARHDQALRWLFRLAAIGLPQPPEALGHP
jgi:farnesyl-diphosphate farnesyltransferase